MTRYPADDAVVLDIGGDVGALVLYTDEGLLGAELDVTSGGRATHTSIRRRRVGGREVICGVYPQLRAGRYTVWGVDGEEIGTVDIEGGRVCELQTSSRRAASSAASAPATATPAAT